jgi:hypothetical protein
LTLTRRYLRNAPIGIVIFALTIYISAKIKTLIKPKQNSSVRSEDLVSPTSDSDLSKLESDVILSALASSILPRHQGEKEKGAEADKGISSDEAEDIIEDFKRYDNVAIERWEKVGWLVSIVGGIALLGVSIARAYIELEWRGLPFPVSQL